MTTPLMPPRPLDYAEYECALTGTVAKGEESTPDELGNLPDGWIRVTIERRVLNSAWLNIQGAKQLLLERALSQLPKLSETALAIQQSVIALSVNAQFHALEKDTPRYLTEKETVFVSPPEQDDDVLQSFNTIRATLGLDVLELDEEDEDENEDESGVHEDASDSADTSSEV